MRSDNLSSNIENEALEDVASMDAPLEKRPGSSLSLFSGMWMKTLLRRDTLLAFVAFMAYFSCCIIPLILDFNRFDNVDTYYGQLIDGSFSLIPLISGCYAVSLSVLLMSYLHSSSSASALHSFPVTRGKLFRSTLLTGTVLLLAPILLVAVLMFIFGQIMPDQAVGYVGPMDKLSSWVIVTGRETVSHPELLFSAPNLIKWFIDTAAGTWFIFAISNLAGVVAGKDIIHALLALFLNAIVLISCALIDLYTRSFILGTDGTSFMDFSQSSQPFLWYTLKRGGALSAKDIPMMLIFIAIAVVITLFTGFLYSRIKLEREQSATVFPVVSDMLVVFLTFCVMSLSGMISAELAPGEHPVYPIMPFFIGCAAGGVPAFIVLRMIADSSVRILNVRTLITFIALIAVTAAVSAFTCFDVLGLSGKLPEPSDVSKVTIQSMAPFNTKLTLSDDDSIRAAVDLHEAVIRHRDDITRDDYSTGSMGIVLDYELKNGSSLKRSYSINAGTTADIRQAAAALAATEEYNIKVENHLRKVILNAGSSVVVTSIGSCEIKKEDIRPLLTAYFNDYKELGSDYFYTLAVKEITTDAEHSFTKAKCGQLNISPVDDDDMDVADSSLFLNALFGDECTRFNKALKKYGYAKELIKAESEYKYEE